MPMTSTRRCLLPLLLAAALPACGTVFSQQERIESEKALVYGGVIFDARWLAAGFSGGGSGDARSEDAGLACLLVPYAIVDLPLCLVADTLILPITIYQAANHDEDVKAFRALVVAAGTGDVESARPILERRPGTVGWWNVDGDSALDIAAKKGDLAMVELLVASGAEAGFRDAQPFRHALFAEKHDVAIFLHQHGITPDQVRKFLERAFDADEPEAVAFILAQQWFPVDGAIEDDLDLLSMAASRGNVAMMTTALDAGADVNRATATGYTALHSAVRGDHPQAVRLLLARGANAGAVWHELQSWRDRTPLDCVTTYTSPEITELLRDATTRAGH